MADTSIWIDHLRSTDALLAQLLENSRVVMHPFILGEISLGHLAKRDETLVTLGELPGAPVADEAEVARLIKMEELFGRGIGYVDAHLLASMRLANGAALWTRDRRLKAVSERLGVAARLTH